jgi:peptidoglycan hydrolase-like protein with peptidoglycan-binding domain
MSANVCAIDSRGGRICSLTPTGGGTAAALAPTDVIPVIPATITASVGLNGANRINDVKTVQNLLNTASRKTGVPVGLLTVDGLSGSLTRGAIKQFQQHHFNKSDSRVDPGQKTIQKLDEIQKTGSGGTVVTPPPPPPVVVTPLGQAMEAVPRAMQWNSAAMGHVAGLMGFGGGPSGAAFSIANVHFHFDRDAGNLTSNLNKVFQTLRLIQQVLGSASQFFREGPAVAGSPFADAPMGGLHFPGTPHNFITFRPGFVSCGPNCRAAMLLHEGAHFVGGTNEIRHFAMEFPFPNGAPQDGSTRNYAQLLTSEAIRNAASYAAFAIHTGTGTDSRFGAADITK